MKTFYFIQRPSFFELLPDVRVRVYEDLHVEHVEDLAVVEGQDALEDEDVGAVHGDGLWLATVRDKVVDGNLDFSTLFQPMQSLFQ